MWSIMWAVLSAWLTIFEQRSHIVFPICTSETLRLHRLRLDTRTASTLQSEGSEGRAMVRRMRFVVSVKDAKPGDKVFVVGSHLGAKLGRTRAGKKDNAENSWGTDLGSWVSLWNEGG